MSNFVIGLTGGIASGKTTVANLFGELGIDIVDADIIAREVVEPGTPGLAAIAAKFGEQILSNDGTLDRARLRELVFSEPTLKHWLNQLLHPKIREQMLLQVNRARSSYCLLVVPLLIENGLESMVDQVLVVDTPAENQVARTMQRDQVSKEQAEAILAAQASREQRLAKADDIVENQGSIEDLTREVKKLHDRYLLMAGRR